MKNMGFFSFYISPVLYGLAVSTPLRSLVNNVSDKKGAILPLPVLLAFDIGKRE